MRLAPPWARGVPLPCSSSWLDAESHAVWGVPTFIVGPAAVFVRLLDRPKSAEDATNTVERILANIGWDNLNEFKHTSVPM